MPAKVDIDDKLNELESRLEATKAQLRDLISLQIKVK
jgi:hypothetical protein